MCGRCPRREQSARVVASPPLSRSPGGRLIFLICSWPQCGLDEGAVIDAGRAVECNGRVGVECTAGDREIRSC
jgi:hypothetical protein